MGMMGVQGQLPDPLRRRVEEMDNDPNLEMGAFGSLKVSDVALSRDDFTKDNPSSKAPVDKTVINQMRKGLWVWGEIDRWANAEGDESLRLEIEENILARTGSYDKLRLAIRGMHRIDPARGKSMLKIMRANGLLKKFGEIRKKFPGTKPDRILQPK